MSTPPDRWPVQLPLGVQLRDSANFSTFFPGPNAEVLRHLEGISQQGVQGAAVHFIAGPAGCGKTHLLQAATHAASRQGRRVAYLPLGELVATEPAALDGLSRMSLVCLDDVQAIVGQREWEEALMALFEGLRAASGGLLAAGLNPPMELGLGLKDLATRLAWGPVYALKPLGDDDKLGLLQQRARGRGLEMPEEVGRFLLTRGVRDIPSLLSVLDRLDHASLAAQRRLTVPFVRSVLE